MERDYNKNEIRALAEVIRQKFHPKQILLFGSHAQGVPSKDSDIDLLVIMDTALPPKEQAFLIRKELDRNVPIDVIVRTPDQVAKRVQLGDLFMKQILAKGINL